MCIARGRQACEKAERARALRLDAVLLRVAALLPGLVLSLACSAHGLRVRDLPPLPEEPLPALQLQEFELGPGDEIEVFVWEHEDLSRRVKITSTGLLPYPLIGDFKVTGMTAPQVRDHVQVALAEYVKDPKVSVSIVAVHSHKVYVFGEVQRPGVYALDSATSTSLLEAIGMAGGTTRDAKRGQVLLIRGDASKVFIRPVDVDALLKDGDLRQNHLLTLGDIVYVPTRTMATIEREARRIVDILSPVLMLETSTILFDQFTETLLHGKPKGNQTTITIIGASTP